MTAKPKDLFNPDAELALVGAALEDTPTFLAADVQPGDFHDIELGHLWAEGMRLAAAGGYFDHISILENLGRHGITISPATPIRALTACTDYHAAGSYAAIIRDYAARRAALARITTAAGAIYSENGTWRASVAAVGGSLAAVDTPSGPARSPVKTSWTVAELLSTDFPDPQWAIPGIMPVGLTFLAGRPKVGKSWLALQIAQAVGTGGMALNQRVTAGKVLYLALEDGPRRLKDRLRKQLAPMGTNIAFETSWRLLADGGLDDLRAAIGGYSLVVIDTLSRALGGADQSDMADMNLAIGELQKLATEFDVSILTIDHHKKPSAGVATDPVDDILGSTAKSAVADAVLGLYKEQGKPGAILKVTGRDIEQQELAVSWDSLTCSWQLEGTLEEVSLRGRKTDVLITLRGKYPDETPTGEILDLTSMKKGNLSPILQSLISEGLVMEHKKGKEKAYSLTPDGLRMAGGSLRRGSMPDDAESES